MASDRDPTCRQAAYALLSWWRRLLPSASPPRSSGPRAGFGAGRFCACGRLPDDRGIQATPGHWWRPRHRVAGVPLCCLDVFVASMRMSPASSAPCIRPPGCDILRKHGLRRLLAIQVALRIRGESRGGGVQRLRAGCAGCCPGCCRLYNSSVARCAASRLGRLRGLTCPPLHTLTNVRQPLVWRDDAHAVGVAFHRLCHALIGVLDSSHALSSNSSVPAIAQ